MVPASVVDRSGDWRKDSVRAGPCSTESKRQANRKGGTRTFFKVKGPREALPLAEDVGGLVAAPDEACACGCPTVNGRSVKSVMMNANVCRTPAPPQATQHTLGGG